MNVDQDANDVTGHQARGLTFGRVMIRKIIDLEQLAPARLASRVKFYKGVQWGDGGAVKGLGLSSWDKRLRARSKGV